jgi:pimeloyl-ACP methyl ester carboxylesterase
VSDRWRFERYRLQSGLNMRIARAGEPGRPLIVMLHGFPECWYSWRHQLRALSDTFECVAPEMRGYGETDAPVGVANYTLDKLVADVADLIHALGRERAAIIGHDWGGAVAWAVALQRSELLERLVVMNCPHLKRFGEELRRNPRQMLRSWYMLFFQIPRLPEVLFRARNFAALDRAMRSSSAHPEAFTDADLRYFHDAFRNPYSIAAAINYYRANFRQNLLARSGAQAWLERKIAVPTLVIWGEQDFVLGKELTYNMEPLFSGQFEIRYIVDSNHWVQQERPDLVNQYLREFLAPLAQSRG